MHERRYSVIGMIGKIKILQCDRASNNPTPTYSNTYSTTYFSYSKEKGCIEHIYYYKGHRLSKSVDFNKGVVPHVHYWNKGIIGRKRHDKHNVHTLSPRDERLLELALKYNKEHHG